MMINVTEDLKSSVDSGLQEFSIETGAQVPDLVHCFDNSDPFLDLATEHMQTKFYRENFNLVVSLTQMYNKFIIWIKMVHYIFIYRSLKTNYYHAL